MHVSRSGLVACFVFALAAQVPAQALIGVRWDDGTLHSISTANASSTPIGTATVNLGDLTRAADGFLYGIAAVPTPSLVRVNPLAGTTTVVGSLGIAFVFEGALAIGPSDVAYGFNAGSAGAPTLFQVDLANGLAHGFVALSNPPHDINGAAFRSDGVLVAIDRETNALVTIDPATGATSVLQVLTPALGASGGLTVAGGAAYFTTGGPGSVYPGSNELWRIDLFTGAHVLVGGLGSIGAGFGISGIAGGTAAIGTTFCSGDGSGAACPCGNASAPADRAGCLHSLGSGGVLRADGTPSVAGDSIELLGSSMPNSSALYFQGTGTLGGGAGAAFGDGLRCAGGTIVRLGTQANVAGASRYPGPGEPTVSVRGAVPAGATRHYQIWFRNAASFCTPSTFNLSNGLTIDWSA